MPPAHRPPHRLTQRFVRSADPRLAKAAGLGGVCSILGLACGVWLDRPVLLGIAGLMLVGAILALIALDEQLRAHVADAPAPQAAATPDDGRPAGRHMGGPQPLSVSPSRGAIPAPALAPGAVLRNRTYPAVLAQLLAADDVPLPDGHAWPDLSRIRGSLAVRAQMAVRFAFDGPVPAASADAPMYVGYAHPVDVASGLHVAALGWRATPLVAFLDASVHPGLSNEARSHVDDALSSAWHASLSDTCTPPAVLRLLLELNRDATGPGGPWILEQLEGARIALRGGSGLAAFLRPWAAWRAQLANEARRGGWSENQRNIAEVLCDWLLLQRACSEDLVLADRDRGPSETRGDALARRDAIGPFVLEQALAAILEPTAVGRNAPDSAAAAALALHDENQSALASAA